MASVSLSTFLLLSLLLCTSFTAHTLPTYPPAEAPHPPHHHHHHHHPPSPPPSHPPPRHPHPTPPSHPPPPPTHQHPTPPSPSPPRSHPQPPSHAHPPPPTHPQPPRHPPPTYSHPPPSPPSHPAPTPPLKPPLHPPIKPPSHPPVKPPTVRKMVAVQGVVYCKSCKFRGVDTLLGATPLVGAVVKLECNNTKQSLKEQTKTDKNGYFLLMPHTLTTAGSHKCKVSLVSSPLAACNVPTNLHGGAAGALLTRRPPVDAPPKKPLPFELFTVGPFAFEAPKKLPCHY